MSNSDQDIDQAQEELRQRIEAAGRKDPSCEKAAERLARMMVDAGVESAEAIRRLKEAGLSAAGASNQVQWAVEARKEARRQAEEAEFADATAICPHCMTPLGRFDHFCPKCGGSITPYVPFSSIGSVPSADHGYTPVNDKKPRGIIVLGMWLILAPSLLGLYLMLLGFAAGWGLTGTGSGKSNYADTAANSVILLIILGLFALYLAILWKVTAHWLRWRQKQVERGSGWNDGQDAEPDEQVPWVGEDGFARTKT